MYVHAPEMSSLSGEKHFQATDIFLHTLWDWRMCWTFAADVVVVALFMCNCGTNLCTASTSINRCSALWIKTVILSMNSLLRLPFDSDKEHIHQPNVLPKSDLLCSPAPTKLNVAVSLERLMFAWSKKCMCMLKYPWFIFILFDTVYSFFFWLDFFKQPLIWIGEFDEKQKNKKVYK